MISGKDIIIISGIEWDALWQGSQEIAERLAKGGNRVLYIENMGVRAPTWGDKRRVAMRVKSWARSLSSRGVRQVTPNLFVCSPIVMPPFGHARQRYLNRRLLTLIAQVATSLGMRDPLLWTFLPTDTALDLINLFRARSSSTVIYHCTADFSELTPESVRLHQSEKELLLLSDVVFVTCRQLAEYCAPWNAKVHIFPNGVSLDVFTQHNGKPEPPDVSILNSIARPIIGYIGGLHRFVDFNLLTEMVRLRPEWSWVFVGPIQTSLQGLDRLPNVHLVRQQPHERLGQFLSKFDVCIVPYLKNSATATVVPTKVNEYLAAGKPVVSTELITVSEFNKQHQVLRIAPSRPSEFLKAMEDSLQAPDDLRTIARRTRVAELNDWQVHLEGMSALIQAEMAKHVSKRTSP